MDLITNLVELLMISTAFIVAGAVIRTKTAGVPLVRPQDDPSRNARV